MIIVCPDVSDWMLYVSPMLLLRDWTIEASPGIREQCDIPGKPHSSECIGPGLGIQYKTLSILRVYPQPTPPVIGFYLCHV